MIEMSPKKHNRFAIYGPLLVLLGVLFTVWTPTEMFLYDRLYMRPGLLPFEWWQAPPESIELGVYLFNVTNHEAFLAGTDAKLVLHEVGPIIFSDNLVHIGTTFNDNDTLTYATKHNLNFRPERNTVDLDSVLVIPNYPLLATASLVSKKNMLTKLLFHGIYRTLKPNLFITITIRNLIWNYTEPFVDKIRKVVPEFMLPIKGDIGLMFMLSPPEVKNITVLIGPKHGHERFFSIDNFDGSRHLPGYQNLCNKTLTDVSETLFHQYIKRTSVLKLFKDNCCRYIKFLYEGDTTKYGVDAYKFSLSKTTFHRTYPLEQDCYRGYPLLPQGVADVSQCSYGMPVVLSYPHFREANFSLDPFTGYQPDPKKHSNYVIVEPLSGCPLESKLSVQLNVRMTDLLGIDDSLKIFKNSFVPIVSVYATQHLPWYIALLVFVAVRLLPILNVVCCTFMIVAGCAMLYLYIEKKKRNIDRNRRKMKNGVKNEDIDEEEGFLS